MAKLTKKTVDKVFEDFKDCLFISEALSINKIRPYDFFDYLKKNDEANKEYKSIEEFNNTYKEAQIEQKVYTSDFSKQILMRYVEANNKKKYTQKYEVDTTTTLSNLTDEEIEKKIKDLQDKYK
jgi:hypothetical protein